MEINTTKPVWEVRSYDEFKDKLQYRTFWSGYVIRRRGSYLNGLTPVSWTRSLNKCLTFRRLGCAKRWAKELELGDVEIQLRMCV